MKIRIGQGIDAHKIKKGSQIILGGVKIPTAFALEGHSDADVLLHAVTDALLGSVSDNDIGYHFPPGKKENKDRDSKDFIVFAKKKVQDCGYSIGNLDCTIICEKPKINEFRDQIRKSIASILNIHPSQISVKATTTEKMGFTGREEGIVATAVVLVNLI